MIKGLIKYFILFLVACFGAIFIYYYTVDESDRIPIGIEISS